MNYKNDIYEDFYNLVKKVHNERIAEEKAQMQTIDYKVHIAFTYFEVWCRANKKDITKHENFKEFINTEFAKDLDLCFLVKRKIAEKHFNIKIMFDYTKMKWVAFNEKLVKENPLNFAYDGKY